MSAAAQPLVCVVEFDMKLYAVDNSELMDIARIYRDGRNLVVDGTIMGAMPIRAVIKPAEMRNALKLVSVKTLIFAFVMLFRGSR
jgi:hypothetical protein